MLFLPKKIAQLKKLTWGAKHRGNKVTNRVVIWAWVILHILYTNLITEVKYAFNAYMTKYIKN